MRDAAAYEGFAQHYWLTKDYTSTEKIYYCGLWNPVALNNWERNAGEWWDTLPPTKKLSQSVPSDNLHLDSMHWVWYPRLQYNLNWCDEWFPLKAGPGRLSSSVGLENPILADAAWSGDAYRPSAAQCTTTRFSRNSAPDFNWAGMEETPGGIMMPHQWGGRNDSLTALWADGRVSLRQLSEIVRGCGKMYR